MEKSQNIGTKSAFTPKEKAVVHNQATIYKQNRISPTTNKMHNK